MRIKILGAGGFIGHNLVEDLKSLGHDVFPIFKNPSLNLTTESRWLKGQDHDFPTPRIVINLAGTWRNATRQEIVQANYKYPKEILKKELTIGGKVIWIQASSYYQTYKSLYGVDKDLYSMQKQMFSDYLKNESIINADLAVLDILLPYLTGPKEPSERIFSKLAFTKINKKSIDLSSGDSILPVLDVRDFSNLIAGRIYSIEQNLYLHFETIYPNVSDVLSLRSHIEKSLADITHLCNFGSLPDRTNEFTVLSELGKIYKIDKKLRSLSVSFNDQVSFLISEMPKN
jgi:nucleoside-diphosphate-sugar epimerase